jgi:diadenosine tetraphosphatase ApaH/serine/threonine PP2A family protein phosphatase
MPFLTMAYAALHPWDDSVRQTFDLVMAAMARGYGNSGVASAVKNVLLPFMRALEEQMDTFRQVMNIREGHEWDKFEGLDTPPEAMEAFLASLPMTLRRDRLLFVHGSPNSQHEYLLPDMDAFAALERVETAGAETLFCGHTHRPYVRELRDGSIRARVQDGAASGAPSVE